MGNNGDGASSVTGLSIARSGSAPGTDPDPDLGPLPSEPTPQPVVSPSRAAVLTVLRDQEEPASLAVVAATTGLHVNTVREHLDALVQQGLAQRQRSAPRGRGRPAWLYEARDASIPRGHAEYAGLAAALAAHIHRTSDEPRADAIAAGTAWGRDLVDEEGTAGTPGADAAPRDADAGRRAVLTLTDDLGFAPRTDTELGTVRLTRCPLLETARSYPDVVCGVHLGIVRGVLGAYAADPADAELVPFAEPGACLLMLGAGAASTPTGQR